MAVQELHRSTHGGGCTCEDCPHGAREGHRRAVAAFVERRDELAAGHGLPAAVARSAGASRTWVSNELAQSARTVAQRSREAGHSWMHLLARRSVIALWVAVGLLAAAQAGTALAAGWSTARTAGLLAALVLAALLTAASRAQWARGGLLAPMVGEDNRLSTSRVVACSWSVVSAFAVLLLTVRLALTAPGPQRTTLQAGFELSGAAGLLLVLGCSCGTAVLVRRVVGVRVATGRLQKLPADRPRGADLLTDDAGRGSFADAQYLLVSTVAVLLAAVRLAGRPDALPQLPWTLTVLHGLSALVYLAAKYAEGGRPVVLSVVRAREVGDLDAPLRIGDDIEIRGTGFVPPGAQTPEMLARLTVRIGAVYVHVPLVPVAGGFSNPGDQVLTVPVPADVEPGRVEVQVVTAAGVESNRCPVELVD
ncbi:hypothetical protein [Streptomyces sp. NPDC006879]|uniref:hypothetical protein n=1 Tax=Streptomyces sp. NPDC006879 TaxID=3364767 RepID=UPI0036991070